MSEFRPGSAPESHPESGRPNRPIFSAERIAQLIAPAPDRVLPPTPEQRRVIEHPLGGSVLVVAGAGSGKTETMANRVVWLVANGRVEPDRVLGLTFTRKAAGELSDRVVRRLDQFAARLRDAAERGALPPEEHARAGQLLAELDAGFAVPEISTYDAFAASIVQEFGVLAGVAPGLSLIDQTVAWRLARETILASRDPELVESSLAIPKLVEHVLALDHAVADNQTGLDRVEQIVAEFSRSTSLPHNAREAERGEVSGKVYAPVRDGVAALAHTPLIARLARDYAEQKRRRGLMEFSDQLRLAMETVERAPEAVRTLRRRTAAVLLDEVQDTSVGQTRLLRTIFAGSAVMAVGDPHQSIYGWRGASAEGLRSFHRDFKGPAASAPTVATLSLSVSWRNPATVLEAANTVAAPLRADAGVEVPVLEPRPQAPASAIEWRFPETLHEELEAVAEWMRAARDEHVTRTGQVPTAAVIFRQRRLMGSFSAALTAAGVPNQIVGVGGLLSTPEVTDLVCTLRCVWYADAGSDLIRLLAGPRYCVGVADLAGLRAAARWFAERDIAQQRLSGDELAEDGALLDPDRRFTILDALDEIAGMRNLDHQSLRGISELGRVRLREAGVMLRQLRGRVGEGVLELLRAAEHALRLDIELDAAEHRGHAGSAAARANLELFAELVDGFLAVDEQGTLASVLAWLERAVTDDTAVEHLAAPEPGTVQLITVHGAKGLEWDLVALPRLVEQEFPQQAREGVGWLRTGQLPDELRGDAAARPALNWRLASHQQELRDAIGDYAEALKERQAEEERRLAYVAVTRAASRLLLSGSFWGGQGRPRNPSPFLRELEASGLLAGGPGQRLPEQSCFESDPSAQTEATLTWPMDPLGRRGEAVRSAGELLRQHLDDVEGADAGAGAGGATTSAQVDPTVELLLAERRDAAERRAAGPTGAGATGAGPTGAGPTGAGATDAGPSAGAPSAPLAERITASTFHEFIEDPVRAERRRLRPVPQRPFRRTRLGNRFHEWVERRSSTVRGTELSLFGPDGTGVSTEPDEFASLEDAQLAELIAQFEQSRWADRQPIAVELEVSLPFAGRRLVCKLDAVYCDGTGAAARYEVVDWKSGRPPRNEAERESRFLQLELYRHAYAQWAGVDPERIEVSLFYVAEGEELRSGTRRSLPELEELWLQAAGRLG